jgi:DNA topoisomerase VI subunit B
MALVWSKKSTGLPIEVLSSTKSKGKISYFRLDIDVYKNQPKVIAEEQRANPNQWRGTEISVIISGKWSSYRVSLQRNLEEPMVL